MAEVVVLDAVEQILLRLEPKYLIRCKRVCKSWHSLISTPSFVKSHLKFSPNKDIYNNNLGHRRIVMVKTFINMSKHDKAPCLYVSTLKWDYYNIWKIVGSSNGLVCVTRENNARIFVTNPSTREVRKFRKAPLLPKVVDLNVWSSFGYDSSTDDYKVVMGIRQPLDGQIVQVLSLKSNTWKLIGLVKYIFGNQTAGISLNGALYWFVFDANNKTQDKPLIVSFDLSKDKFVEIPQPDHIQYKWNNGSTLGIVEDSLCILSSPGEHPHGTWVLRNYNVKQSWELLSNDYEMQDDVAHSMNMFMDRIATKKNRTFFCDDDTHSSRTGKYLSDPIFVQSLVSPYLNGRPSHTKNVTPVSSKCVMSQQANESVGTTNSGSKSRSRKRSREIKNPITATA